MTVDVDSHGRALELAVELSARPTHQTDIEPPQFGALLDKPQ